MCVVCVCVHMYVSVHVCSVCVCVHMYVSVHVCSVCVCVCVCVPPPHTPPDRSFLHTPSHL